MIFWVVREIFFGDAVLHIKGRNLIFGDNTQKRTKSGGACCGGDELPVTLQST